ncbi:PKD domain-containing protein, partial [Candidatus Micrarchaeota archaeon]|nr:PKD domain-containing protein [Candidatus Micrarchaeota archaeon]
TTTTTQQQTTENVPPTAFAGTDRIAVNGQLITLSGTASDPDGIIISYSWNFGDGRTGSGQTASHTYLSPGTYTATLTVMDNRGAVASDSARITVISQSTDDSTSDTIERVLATPSLSRPGQKISVLITADASAVMVEVAGQTTTLTDFNGDHLFSYEFIAPADEGNYNVVVSTLDGLETRTAEFEVDNSAPTLTIPAQLNSTAPETEITVETNENSECRLSTQDVAFERMKTFDSTGGRTHKTSVKLEFDGENNFYARCQDAAGNVQLESKAVNVKRERAGTSSISGLASGSLSDPIVGGAVLAGAVAIALTATLLYRRHL